MFPDYINHLFYIVGEVVVLLILSILILSLLVALLVLYSFKTGNFLAARAMLLGIILLEGLVKPIAGAFRMDDSIVDDVGVRLRNYINNKEFLKVPCRERTIFMPQCLRSIECPAKLTPEGIKCVSCGRCGIGEAKRFAEGLGYRFFIVPGSSFIKRMVKKYHPQAIVGVGCHMEVKEGLDLCHSYALPARGVLLTQAGCVATTLDWEQFYEAITEGEPCQRARKPQ
ncbi:MAG TPA: DUF116 domain-containing protein [Methanothrix sp.]|jgi:hypothetical protein|nr:DUF116 domain-containing protein [Methanothrix sp.]HOV82553.1 DUF116 domain-containing protein [Methanothrix sp.]HPC90524.1 DUF116 domain-containing protein [Methanothrix sp.]HQI68691.1 DUF116 domain-containing protein [Methanothrix sp.]HRS85662.1 DUF116 domain-containing protein [Methanothrix sp.]